MAKYSWALRSKLAIFFTAFNAVIVGHSTNHRCLGLGGAFSCVFCVFTTNALCDVRVHEFKSLIRLNAKAWAALVLFLIMASLLVAMVARMNHLEQLSIETDQTC